MSILIKNKSSTFNNIPSTKTALLFLTYTFKFKYEKENVSFVWLETFSLIRYFFYESDFIVLNLYSQQKSRDMNTIQVFHCLCIWSHICRCQLAYILICVWMYYHRILIITIVVCIQQRKLSELPNIQLTPYLTSAALSDECLLLGEVRPAAEDVLLS